MRRILCHLYGVGFIHNLKVRWLSKLYVENFDRPLFFVLDDQKPPWIMYLPVKGKLAFYYCFILFESNVAFEPEIHTKDTGESGPKYLDLDLFGIG